MAQAQPTYDEDTYTYGLKVIGFNGLILIGWIIIGALFGQARETLIWIVMFCPLRIMAGGYHASTMPVCFTLSMAIGVLVNMILKICPFTSIAPVVTGLVLLMFVVILTDKSQAREVLVLGVIETFLTFLWPSVRMTYVLVMALNLVFLGLKYLTLKCTPCQGH